MNPTTIKTGILGGGQLGKMLALAAHNWDLDTWVLDQDKSFPAGPVCSHFVAGNFKDFEDVYAFGKQVDVLTIEIEHVHTGALRELEQMGKVVHPRPEALDIIKDKGLQKAFYEQQGLPSAPFRLFAGRQEILQAHAEGRLALPFVQKTREAGYDGKGVCIVRTEAGLEQVMDAPSVVEPLCDIEMELAVIVARNARGQVATYDPVEMVFHPVANLVEMLVCPARIPDAVARQARELAVATIEAFDICGLLAVEMFLLADGRLWLNEVAPRPHNSGHHTIEAAWTSQFEQHLRAILDLPLGPTDLLRPAVMVNLLGAADSATGPARWEGLEEVLGWPGVYVHNYGKAVSKPFRKMGHATVLADTLDEAIERARSLQQQIRIYGA